MSKPPTTSSTPFDPRSLYSSSSASTSGAGSPAKAGSAASPPAPSASNVKRESTGGNADDADSSSSPSAGKKKPSKRRKVNLACIYCRRSHMTCDEGRPCQRCIKRDIGHLCHDEATPAKAHGDGESAEGKGTPSKAKASTSSAPAETPATAVTSAATTAAAAQAVANFFPTLGLPGTGGNGDGAATAFSGGSSGPYSSVSPMSSLNQGANTGFNAANIFKPQAAAASNTANATGGFPMQPSRSSGGGGANAAGMLSLASLFNNSIAANNNNNVGTATSSSMPAPGQATPTAAAGAGGDAATSLNGAGWLGLGGGPGGYEGGGSGFGGDSAGGNEFTLLSEFLESLDGPGFGAGATPGMNQTNAGTGGTGLTPSQSRRNTISGLTNSAPGVLDGIPTLTPINNNNSSSAAAPTSSSGSTVYGDNGGGFENGSGKRSRRNSFSAANSTTTAASGSYLPSLQGGSSKTERFFLTAADQKDGTRDERLARVIQAKYEAGLLRPYNHVNGYARLNRWMERNVSAASRRRILKPLSVFRPAFRAIAQQLTTIDLIFIEEAFERLLLDYDRVFSTQGIPACLWRRTGEIYKGNKEFAELVGVPIESLREGRLCIYELMAEESGVNYWEKYGAVSFDAEQKAVLTSCVLRTKNKAIVASGQKEEEKEGGKVGVGTGATSTSGVLKDPNNPKAAFIHCCFSFTIRRDQWNIPHMIVGNFLPTNPV